MSLGIRSDGSRLSSVYRCGSIWNLSLGGNDAGNGASRNHAGYEDHQYALEKPGIRVEHQFLRSRGRP